jgi:hypothetical protein
MLPPTPVLGMRVGQKEEGEDEQESLTYYTRIET